ncbi:MAG TPA: hypothetical protein VFX92_02835 [Candidatus Krumholzibacteria bacterium]|nr:hypothetical protein [Candidatus Krumholzibacteria bacterium]
MKLLRTLFMALALLALLAPTLSFGDQLPLPLEKKLTAGTSTLNYWGQTFRFTSPVALLVRCEPETTTRFKMSVVIYPGTPQTNAPSSNTLQDLMIYWENFNTDVYTGGVPVIDPWTGSFTTEGGFVDR